MKKCDVITISDEGLNRHLERLVRLGVYGGSISEVAATIVRRKLVELICGDEIDEVEGFIAETIRQKKVEGVK